MTIAIGGVEIVIKLLVKLRISIEDHCLIGLCSTKREGALTNKQFQTVVSIVLVIYQSRTRKSRWPSDGIKFLLHGMLFLTSN